ncbi:MAG: class I SAM-dependent methyltransferase [Myxococcota bacterium]
MARYDTIGQGYAQARRSDPRLAARILAALGDCRSVVNVGAGTGSYEPVDRSVLAVEPSPVMIRQRAPSAAPVVQAAASHLPFRDAAFDGSLAILTLHHWTDLDRGLQELSRAARKRTVILTYDNDAEGFWLTEYFPQIRALDAVSMPSIERIRKQLGRAEVFDVPVPVDCTDGFLGAYWCRPEAYLRPEVRAGISVFASLDEPEAGLARLRDDLASGAWEQQYGWVRGRSELDVGYRLLVA